MSRVVDSRRGGVRGRGPFNGSPELFRPAGLPPGPNTDLRTSGRTWLGTMLAVAGSIVGVGLVLSAGAGVRGFLDYFAGVISLVALTAAVVWGVISTGSSFLGPRNRLWAQGVHRVLAVISVGFLVLHVGIKVSEQHVSLLDAFLPVGFTTRGVLIAVGVVAGYLLVLAVATGVARGAFARRHPVRWRMLHATSYISWLAALVHGLKAGRPAAWWVTAGYLAALIAVGVAGAIRMRAPARHELAHSIRRSAVAPTGRRRAQRRRRAAGPARLPLSPPPQRTGSYDTRSRIEGRR